MRRPIKTNLLSLPLPHILLSELSFFGREEPSICLMGADFLGWPKEGVGSFYWVKCTEKVGFGRSQYKPGFKPVLVYWLNPLPPNIPDLEHHICQWTTNGSQEDLSNAGVFGLVWSHSWLLRSAVGKTHVLRSRLVMD